MVFLGAAVPAMARNMEYECVDVAAIVKGAWYRRMKPVAGIRAARWVPSMVACALLIGGCLFDTWDSPKSIRVGVLPGESPERLTERYAPLLKYLSETTDLPHELVIPRDYAHLLELMHNKDVDLGYFGGLTFLKAHSKGYVIPLVMSDKDMRFATYFLARADNPAMTIPEYRGKRLAFGSKLSTSGHLMPRHFLKGMNIDPEKFFGEVEFSGTHDRTAFWVRDGKAELGAANAVIVDAMFRDGALDPSEVKIVWRTPPYADYVWALRTQIDPKIRDKIRDAFLKLSLVDNNGTEILGSIDAGGFLPARLDDFAELRKIAEDLGLF